MNVTVVYADNANLWQNTFKIDTTSLEHTEILPRTTVTVAEAISISGFEDLYKGEAPISTLKVGVWGEFVTMNTEINDGDRIEIYIPSKGTKADLIRKKQSAVQESRKLPNK